MAVRIEVVVSSVQEFPQEDKQYWSAATEDAAYGLTFLPLLTREEDGQELSWAGLDLSSEDESVVNQACLNALEQLWGKDVWIECIFLREKTEVLNILEATLGDLPDELRIVIASLCQSAREALRQDPSKAALLVTRK